MPSIEQLAPIIIDTLPDSIELSAGKVIQQGELNNVHESDIIDSIKLYRRTRKGLENCCKEIMKIYKSKNPEPEIPDLREDSNWADFLKLQNPFNLKP